MVTPQERTLNILEVVSGRDTTKSSALFSTVSIYELQASRNNARLHLMKRDNDNDNDHSFSELSAHTALTLS